MMWLPEFGTELRWLEGRYLLSRRLVEGGMPSRFSQVLHQYRRGNMKSVDFDNFIMPACEVMGLTPEEAVGGLRQRPVDYVKRLGLKRYSVNWDKVKYALKFHWATRDRILKQTRINTYEWKFHCPLYYDSAYMLEEFLEVDLDIKEL